MNDLTGDRGFTEQDFLKYIGLFNHNDFDGFAEYYADNIIFEGRSRYFKNRVEVVNFYRKLKSRIRETVTVREMLIGKNEIAVEIETELYAFKDWLDMPTGPMHKGETIRSRNFVWYEIQNKKFVHIRSAHYRRIGSSEKSSGPYLHTIHSQKTVSEERFTEHVGAFNRNDCAFLGDCLHEDMVLGIGGKKGLKGREAVLNFCKIVKMQTQSTVEIKKIINSGDLLAAELLFELVALNDLPDFITGPMKKNGRIFMNVFALCQLHSGRFTRIRLAKFSKTKCP
jgi:hypothetical protein